MSYCVNCGVELKNTKKSCPLCGVKVLNPIKPANLMIEKILPRKEEVPQKPFDKNLWIKLVSIILAAPALITVTIEWFFGNTLTWSLYVIVSLGLTWIWCISPFLFSHNYIAVWWTIDTVGLLGFLFIVQALSGTSGWFYPLALPVTMSMYFLSMVLIQLIKQQFLRELHIVAAIFFACGIFCVLLNGSISFYLINRIQLNWSLLVLISCIAFASIAMVLQQRKWIVEELKYWFRL